MKIWNWVNYVDTDILAITWRYPPGSKCFLWSILPYELDDHFHDRRYADDDYCYLQICHQKRVVEWNNMKVLYLAITCDIGFFDDQLQ